MLLKLEEYVDLIIPRGGEDLIRAVVSQSKIPVIKHYKGVCHVFVDAGADIDMAVKICMNAKAQRPGVCNAMETLLVHEIAAGHSCPPWRKPCRRRASCCAAARDPGHPAGARCGHGEGLARGVPGPHPGGAHRRRARRSHRPHRTVRLPAHRVDRHARLRQRAAIPQRGEFLDGPRQRLNPFQRRLSSSVSAPRSGSARRSCTPSGPWASRS